jgi:hypothetical protein
MTRFLLPLSPLSPHLPLSSTQESKEPVQNDGQTGFRAKSEAFCHTAVSVYSMKRDRSLEKLCGCAAAFSPNGYSSKIDSTLCKQSLLL